MISDNALLDKVKLKWGSAEDTFHFIKFSQNFIYELRRQNDSIILRFSQDSHRTREQIAAELDWINHLTINGIPVIKPIKSVNENYIETFISNETFHVVGFEYITHNRIDIAGYTPQQRKKFFRNWGQIQGKMHRLAKSYTAKKNQRYEWYEDELISDVKRYLPPEMTKVHSLLNTIKNQLHTFPKNRDEYGLVHNDIHAYNMLGDENGFTLIDFDQSCYHWFAADIAMIIYYIMSHLFCCADMEKQAIKKLIHSNFKYFVEGYNSENTFQSHWIKWLPVFLQLRDVCLVALLYKKRDVKYDPEERKLRKRYYREINKNIETGISFIDLELQNLNI